MSKGNAFFTFLAGALAGAALFQLAKSEKGQEVIRQGKSAVLDGLDKVEEALKQKKEECCQEEAEEQEAE